MYDCTNMMALVEMSALMLDVGSVIGGFSNFCFFFSIFHFPQDEHLVRSSAGKDCSMC